MGDKMAETIQISGLKEVQKKLYSYSQQLGDRVVYGALRAGAAVMRKSVMANVPFKTGKLRKGFKIARSKIHRGRLSTDMIGIYLALRKGKDAPYYGRFINDGWFPRGKREGRAAAQNVALSNRSGRVTGFGGKFIQGKHFIQRSFSAARADALRVIISNASAGAEVLARKLGL